MISVVVITELTIHLYEKLTSQFLEGLVKSIYNCLNFNSSLRELDITVSYLFICCGKTQYCWIDHFVPSLLNSNMWTF